jgi:hypothetical protein
MYKEFVNNFESVFYKDADLTAGNKLSLYLIAIKGFNSITVVNNSLQYIYIGNYDLFLGGRQIYKYVGNENEIVNTDSLRIITVYGGDDKYGVAIIKKQFI